MERPEKEDKEFIEDIEKRDNLKNKKLKTEILINLTDIYNTHKILSEDKSTVITNKLENKITEILDDF